MDKNEMLIDRLREVAKGMDTPQSRTLMQAADALSNQKSNIAVLQNRLEWTRAERDTVICRMIKLEEQYANLLKDFEASLLGDPCDYCANCLTSDKRCEESDLDCEVCRHDDCVCKRCTDLDSWTWRGLEAGHAEA